MVDQVSNNSSKENKISFSDAAKSLFAGAASGYVLGEGTGLAFSLGTGAGLLSFFKGAASHQGGFSGSLLTGLLVGVGVEALTVWSSVRVFKMAPSRWLAGAGVAALVVGLNLLPSDDASMQKASQPQPSYTSSMTKSSMAVSGEEGDSDSSEEEAAWEKEQTNKKNTISSFSRNSLDYTSGEGVNKIHLTCESSNQNIRYVLETPEGRLVDLGSSSKDKGLSKLAEISGKAYSGIIFVPSDKRDLIFPQGTDVRENLKEACTTSSKVDRNRALWAIRNDLRRMNSIK